MQFTLVNKGGAGYACPSSCHRKRKTGYSALMAAMTASAMPEVVVVPPIS